MFGSAFVVDVFCFVPALLLLRQRCQLPLLLHWCEYRCYPNVNIAVTALSVVTAVTALSVPPAASCHRCHTSVHSNVTAVSLPSLLHRCQFTSLTHWCCCHRCHSAVWTTAATAQLSTLLSQYCYYHLSHTNGNCHRCVISVDSSVTVV